MLLLVHSLGILTDILTCRPCAWFTLDATQNSTATVKALAQALTSSNTQVGALC